MPADTNVGGIGIFVKSTLNITFRDDLKIISSNNNKAENLWIEIVKSSTKNIVAGIYRHLGQRIDVFNDSIRNSLNVISQSKTTCVVVGDYNINLLNYKSRAKCH